MRKIYADSTLMTKSKRDLIVIIRQLENKLDDIMDIVTFEIGDRQKIEREVKKVINGERRIRQ